MKRTDKIKYSWPTEIVSISVGYECILTKIEGTMSLKAIGCQKWMQART